MSSFLDTFDVLKTYISNYIDKKHP